MAQSPQPVSIEDALAGDAFDALIDARSPAEFAEDHLPGALNWPVLDDAQRARVGTLYVQDSPLAARKLGATLACRNIAAHLEAQLADKPREWRPLVYCWRGGQRSGSLALVLAQVGFRTGQLRGGYKAFRAHVRTQLQTLPAPLRFVVLCGRTGSGKTRLLQALRAAGAQVLDLEGLAHHRGSVLGALPGLPQPTQKQFDTRVWHALQSLDPARAVFVESESAKIGRLSVPPALLAHMHDKGQPLRLRTADAARAELLLADYAQSTLAPEALCTLLEGLRALRGGERVERWQALARARQWPQLVAALLHEHYDPLYERSMQRSYAGLAQAPQLQVERGDDAEFAALAATLRAQAEAGIEDHGLDCPA
ncbi:MAG: tRNA 2-selenouridine(34) synthase MnmH [Rubrivivax sp. SCN 71-131]|jgi:tRNA 2-selenouridine synthase|nr:MAG: tRNA 2-selenouridine(34) synthase MnmH [Rubrivivax sp. SCN 71-131]